mmetsp:Transcript_80289/g.194641  ORF Transcript_80289/g.194641 Transcript_80289/m.194641 type:complete len:258 (-) Transcript_80289:193-966(-)
MVHPHHELRLRARRRAGAARRCAQPDASHRRGQRRGRGERRGPAQVRRADLLRGPQQAQPARRAHAGGLLGAWRVRLPVRGRLAPGDPRAAGRRRRAAVHAHGHPLVGGGRHMQARAAAGQGARGGAAGGGQVGRLLRHLARAVLLRAAGALRQPAAHAGGPARRRLLRGPRRRPAPSLLGRLRWPRAAEWRAALPLAQLAAAGGAGQPGRCRLGASCGWAQLCRLRPARGAAAAAPPVTGPAGGRARRQRWRPRRR